MNRIAFLSAAFVLLLSSCDNFFPAKKQRPAGKTLENVSHIPDGCNLLDFIDNQKLDLNARTLCAGQQVLPVPTYLFDAIKTCAPELRPMYLKAVTNISGYAFDDQIAERSAFTLADCSDWFFDVASGPCFDNSDLGIWADNVILLFRKKRDARGNIKADSIEGFLLVLKKNTVFRTIEGQETFVRFEGILRHNWKDYLRNEGQPV